jgi:hypothetical protein
MQLGDAVTHTTLARLAGSLAGVTLLIAALAAPAATLAARQPIADPPATTVVAQSDGEDPTGDQQPTDAPPTDAPPTDGQPTDGDVVYDPVFITPTPDATPVGAVRSATGRPEVTPPATDTIGSPGRSAPTAAVEGVLAVLGGLSALILLLGRPPGARRR